MKSLTKCMQSAGKGLSKADKAFIRDVKQDYMDNGMKADEASTRAVQDYISMREDSIAEIRDEIGATNPQAKDGLYMVAYHGTPHRFDTFSLDAIGSGEGQQAYGWGLYFAGDRAVAEWYRDKLARDSFPILNGEQADMKAFMAEYPNIRPEDMQELFQGLSDPYESVVITNNLFISKAIARSDMPPTAAQTAAIDDHSRFQKDLVSKKVQKRKGNLYKVDIPEENNLLDYNSPINKQHPDIQKRLEGYVQAKLYEQRKAQLELRKLGEKQSKDIFAMVKLTDKMKAKKLQNVIKRVDRIKGSGEMFYRYLSQEMGGDMKASQFLDTLGIKGLRFLDNNSRSPRTKKPYYNYVIFDDTTVTVEEVNDQAIQAERQEALYSSAEKIGWTEDRIDYVIRDTEHVNRRETKGLMAIVNPMEFVNATVSSARERKVIQSQATDLDMERLKAESQTPYLKVFQGKVEGHEGRHRLVAMARAGITEVPVVIHLNEYVRSAPTSMRLKGQTFRGEFGGPAGTGSSITLKNPVPLMTKNRDKIVSALNDTQALYSTNDLQGQPGSASTQVATTIGSYRKAAQKIKALFKNPKNVLDYGAGYGLGTDVVREVFDDVESFEPYPESWRSKDPVNYTDANKLDKKYDGVISLNVLNVMQPELRANSLRKIVDLLNVGGVAVISTRKWKGDVGAVKNYRPTNENHAVWVRKTSGDSYQRGFDGNELIDFVNETIPEGIDVVKDNSFGGAGVVITKNEETALYSSTNPDEYKIGDLTELRKRNPQAYRAVQASIKRLPVAEQKRVRANFKRLKGTGWATITVKELVYRELIHRALNKKPVEALANNAIWKKDGGNRIINRQTFKAFMEGGQFLDNYIENYNFIGNNAKAENDISTSHVNCEPSLECAKYCYTFAQGYTNEIARSELTEWAVENRMDLVAKSIEKNYKYSAAGEHGLMLRLNDKGDLSRAQVKLIAELNKRGIELQVFSKRPELLRQLDPMNWRSLSIDKSNFEVARDNPDLDIALVLDADFSEDVLQEYSDRISVTLPLKLGRSAMTRKDIAKLFPNAYAAMRHTICPVDGGGKEIKSYLNPKSKDQKFSFVHIMKKIDAAAGYWTCTACNLFGAAGCYNAKNRQIGEQKAREHSSDLDQDMIVEQYNSIVTEFKTLLRNGEMTDEEFSIVSEALATGRRAVRKISERRTASRGGQEISVNDITGREGRESPSFQEEVAEQDTQDIKEDPADQALYSTIFGEDLFEAPEAEGFLRTFRKGLQDKLLPLKIVQEKIESGTGERITNDLNTYIKEELLYGKAENDLNELETRFIEPLISFMAENNIEQKELDLFLYAAHAEERNNLIASRNAEMPDGGSGMTTAEARAILSGFAAEGKPMEKAAQFVYDMMADKRRRLVEAGVLTQKESMAWEQMFSKYVPLKGFQEDQKTLSQKIAGKFTTPEDGQPERLITPRTGKGFDVRGKESMAALGRRSLAASPLATSLQDSTAAIMRARKNEVAQTFLKMVAKYPKDGYWKIHSAGNMPTERGRNPVTGMVEDIPVSPMAMKPENGYLGVKVNGQQVYIWMQDSNLAEAMGNLGPQQMNEVLQSMGKITRWMSAMNTSLNPEFIISNMARDVQTGIYNLLAEVDMDDGKAISVADRKEFVLKASDPRNIFSAVGGIFKAMYDTEGSVNNEWSIVFRDFVENGGKTGFFDMKDFNQIAKDLEKDLSIATGGIGGNSRKGLKKLAEFIENGNLAIENAIRLTAYRYAVEGGLTKQEAASLAKNLTVNFNRKGKWSWISSLYMFFNASVQGTYQFARSVGRVSDLKRGGNLAQKAAGSMILSGYLMGMLNRMLGGEDDDGEAYYDKIEDYVIERNFVLMKSVFGGPEDGTYWSIPLPYGYNVFANMGTTIEMMMNGSKRKTPAWAGKFLTFSGLGSFMPLSLATSDSALVQSAKASTPTVLRPYVDMIANENYFGRDIYRFKTFDQFEYPDSIGKKKTPEIWKFLPRFLNDATNDGKGEYFSGWLDIAPESLQYIYQSYLGGAGATLDRTINMVEKTAAGKFDELKAREIPLYRRISGEVSEYKDQADYFERRNEILALTASFEKTEGMETIRFEEEYGYILDLEPAIKQTDKAMRQLRKERKKLYDIDDEESEDMIDEIDKDILKLMGEFNELYNSATGFAK